MLARFPVFPIRSTILVARPRLHLCGCRESASISTLAESVSARVNETWSPSSRASAVARLISSLADSNRPSIASSSARFVATATSTFRSPLAARPSPPIDGCPRRRAEALERSPRSAIGRSRPPAIGSRPGARARSRARELPLPQRNVRPRSGWSRSRSAPRRPRGHPTIHRTTPRIAPPRRATPAARRRDRRIMWTNNRRTPASASSRRSPRVRASSIASASTSSARGRSDAR